MFIKKLAVMAVAVGLLSSSSALASTEFLLDDFEGASDSTNILGGNWHSMHWGEGDGYNATAEYAEPADSDTPANRVGELTFSGMQSGTVNWTTVGIGVDLFAGRDNDASPPTLPPPCGLPCKTMTAVKFDVKASTAMNVRVAGMTNLGGNSEVLPTQAAIPVTTEWTTVTATFNAGYLSGMPYLIALHFRLTKSENASPAVDDGKIWIDNVVLVGYDKDAVDNTVYSAADVSVINTLINSNGLNWTPNSPGTWPSTGGGSGGGITWCEGDNGEMYICAINLRERGLTGTASFAGLSGLGELTVTNNQLTGLNLSGCSSLWVLNAGHNQLTTLNVSGNTGLEYLAVDHNQLTEFDVSNNTALINLWVDHNKLTEFDVSNNTALRRFSVHNNLLTTFDASGLTALEDQVLDFSNNQLTALDVSGLVDLKRLNVNFNRLTSLNVSNNTALTNLNVGNNRLTALDVSNNAALTSLDVSNNDYGYDYEHGYKNQLTALNVSNNTALTSLSVRGNKLTSLDLSGLNNLDTTLHGYYFGNQTFPPITLTAVGVLYRSKEDLFSPEVVSSSMMASIYPDGDITWNEDKKTLASDRNTTPRAMIYLETGKDGVYLSGQSDLEYIGTTALDAVTNGFGSWVSAPMATTNTLVTARAAAQSHIDGLLSEYPGVTGVVTDKANYLGNVFVAAVAGDKDEPYGSNGTYHFVVELSDAGSDLTAATGDLTLFITATMYDYAEEMSAAVAAIEGAVYTAPMSQAVNSSGAQSAVLEIIYGLEAYQALWPMVIVSDSGFTAAVAGTSDNPSGTNGIYHFGVTLDMFTAAVSTKRLTLTITATPYDTGPDDNIAVVAAADAIGEYFFEYGMASGGLKVAQSSGNTQEELRAYVLEFIGSITLANPAPFVSLSAQSSVVVPGLNGVVVEIVGETFEPAIAGTSTNTAGRDGSYTFSMRLTRGASVEWPAGPYTFVITATPYDATSVLTSDRVIPVNNDKDAAVIAPVNVSAFELSAGPNPVRKTDGVVNIFITGKRIDNGTLTVFDGSGNVVNKINIRDNVIGNNGGRRAIGNWNLKDSKGKIVSDGAYLLRGSVKTVDGKRERVSVIIGVR